mmetsp:Transcript_12440/g.53360  ORF Transcript_12440/g.53360 Transcript_12440/m.53360 type:complete len:224 (-) Transcript_12440:231-902(-)
MNTKPSCPHVATVFMGKPMFTLQHASRTQSPCARNTCSSCHAPVVPSCRQIFARLSHPLVTRRLTAVTFATPPATRLPGGGAGDQDTPVHPMECAFGIFAASQLPSGRWVKTETEPSEEAAASARPCSCGAHATAFTDASCRDGGEAYTCENAPGWFSASRQTMTLLSNPHDASNTPNLGCAHEHIHTGPSWPVRFATSVCCSPETSNTLIVRSEEHVATRLP